MDKSAINLNIVKTETAPCCLALAVEVLPARVQKTFGEVIAMFSNQVKVPGFRAGKVPAAVIEKRFGKDVVSETKSKLIQNAFADAVKEEKIAPAGYPDIESSDELTFNQNTSFNVKFNLETVPEFELPQYKGLVLEKKNITIADSQVDDVLKNGLERYTKYDKTDDPAQAGDMVRVDYAATIPEGFEHTDKSNYILKADNTWIVLKEPEMLPGVTPSLVGATVGTEKDVDITFADTHYNKEIAGKTLTYHIKVNEVHKATVPELNDDFAKQVGAESMEDLRTRISNNLKAQEENAEAGRLQKVVLDTLTAHADFALPPKVLDNEKNAIAGQKYQAELRQGTKKEDLEGKKEQFLADAEKEATQKLRQTYILRKITEAEKISVDVNELNAVASAMANMYGMPLDKFVKQIEKNDRMADIYQIAIEQKTIKFIIDNAAVAELKEDK